MIQSEVYEYLVRSINLVTIWVIRNNYLHRNMGPLLQPKKNYETGYGDYWGMSMLPAPYTVLSNILLWSLTPHRNKITGNHQCRVLHTRLPTDHIVCIGQYTVEKMLIYCSSTKPTYKFQESLKMSLEESFLTEFGLPMKLVW